MSEKRKTVYVPMAADIIHPGHVNILKTAASYGDVIVGLFTDEAIASYKRVPYMPYEQRAVVIENMKGVVKVIPQYTKDYEDNLRMLKPKYMVHGTDWRTGPLAAVRQKAIDIMAEWGGEVIEPEYTQGVSSSLIQQKIKERGWEAITLIDVDGMKKLEGFPPAMVFMLLERYCSVLTVPENDVMGAVTQLIMKYISGQEIVPYMEYYEFFENSMLIGVPDFVPAAITDGDVTVLPAAFGLLNASLLNVSKVKTGYITCARLAYVNGWYKMHVYTAEAKTPPAWNEFGWDDPAPQLPSLEVFPDSCTVEEFAQNVSSQHVIVAYGNYTEALRDFCKMMDIEFVM